MIVVKEMQKLRDWLDEHNIQWVDKSEEPVYLEYFHRYSFWMCRTHFDINDKHVSVINGYGSYGGVSVFDGHNEGLLEMMCDWIPDVTGYLTADEVISMINEKISGGTGNND